MKGKVLLYVVVVFIGVSLWITFRRTPYDQAVQARELATRVLGEELARRYPGTSALIISNPFAERRGLRKEIVAVEDAGIRGLKKGLGDKVKVSGVVYPAIRPDAESNPWSVEIPDTTTPLSYLVADEAFDQLAESHPDCELLISLIGLPAQLDKVALWNKTGPPRLALLLPDFRMIARADQLKAAVKSGKLAAFVLPKPGGPPEQAPLKKEYQAEFQDRYVLVTDANIDQLLAEQPKLFHFAKTDRNKAGR